jgi:hypothetical protein
LKISGLSPLYLLVRVLLRWRWVGMLVAWYWQGNTEILGGNTWHGATSSTTKPTRNVPDLASGLPIDRPATNRLRHSTVFEAWHLCKLYTKLLQFLPLRERSPSALQIPIG